MNKVTIKGKYINLLASYNERYYHTKFLLYASQDAPVDRESILELAEYQHIRVIGIADKN